MDEELQEKFNELKAKVTLEGTARFIIKGIASHSVGFVASQLVKTYVPTENKKQELQLQVGAYVMGGMAGDKAADWAEEQIDHYLAVLRGVMTGWKKAKTSEEETESQEEPPTE